MSFPRIILLASVGVLGGGLLVWCWLSEGKVSALTQDVAGAIEQKSADSVGGRTVPGLVRKTPWEIRSQNAVAEAQKKLSLEESDDKLLQEVLQGLLEELNEAIQAKDFSHVRRVIAKLSKIRFGDVAGGGRNVSSSVKKAVLVALGGMGLPGVMEELQFVKDSSGEVADTAKDDVLYALRDLRNGDVDCAELAIAAASELTDSKSLDVLFKQLGRMRNSVGVEVLTQIAKSGSEEARERLPSEIAQFAKSAEITTPEDLAKWLESNPDPVRADQLYGPRNVVVAR